MDADERQYPSVGAKRIRLSTMLLLSPLLALVFALSIWITSLRNQVGILEQRVATIEMQQLLAMDDQPRSSVGVLFDIDRAMQIETNTRQRY